MSSTAEALAEALAQEWTFMSFGAYLASHDDGGDVQWSLAGAIIEQLAPAILKDFFDRVPKPRNDALLEIITIGEELECSQ